MKRTMPRALHQAVLVALFLPILLCKPTYPALKSLGRYLAGGQTTAVTFFAKGWDTTPGLEPGDANSLLWTSVANDALNPGKNYSDGAIYVIPRAGRLVSGGASLTPSDSQLVTNALKWVTGVTYLPPNTPGLSLPFKALLTVNGRFPTAPRFSSPSVGGSISLINVDSIPTSNIFKISGDGDNPACEYYYARHVKLMDVNKDGLLDVVATRYRDAGACPTFQMLPPFPFVVELVAFLQPASSPFTNTWTKKVLLDFGQQYGPNVGPIAGFQFLDLDAACKYKKSGNSHAFELVATEFFNNSAAGALAVYYLKKGTSWLDEGKVVGRKVLEEGLAGMFDVRVVDLNGDGVAEVVATTHTPLPSNGIYSYHPPKNDLRKGKWTRRTIHTGFDVVPRPGPGFFLPLRPSELEVYFPTTSRAGKSLKPLIAVATDGGGQLTLLTPASQQKSSWAYNLTVIDQDACDVTAPLVADMDGDGYKEVFAPCLRNSEIFVSSHKQQ